MIALVALLLAATPEVEDAYRAMLIARDPMLLEPKSNPMIRVTELPQPYFEGLRFFFAEGWAQGGHLRLPAQHFAMRTDAVLLVLPEVESFDKYGDDVRLKLLGLCPAAPSKAVCSSLSQLAKERFVRAFAEKQPRDWLDGLALLLAALTLEQAALTPVKSQRDFDAAVVSKVPPVWTKGVVPLAPWSSKATGKSYAATGMVSHPSSVDLLEVRFERGELSIVSRSVARGGLGRLP